MGADSGAVWRIPGHRMKAGKDHDVPLTDAALDVLARVRPLGDGAPDTLLFPSPSPRSGRVMALSDMALTALLRRMHAADVAADGDGWTDPTNGRTITAHGFRSALRDWCGENDIAAREVVEATLAHRNADKTEAAYARGNLLPRRRHLLDAWAAFCDGDVSESDNVVSITPHGSRRAAS